MQACQQGSVGHSAGPTGHNGTGPPPKAQGSGTLASWAPLFRFWWWRQSGALNSLRVWKAGGCEGWVSPAPNLIYTRTVQLCCAAEVWHIWRSEGKSRLTHVMDGCGLQHAPAQSLARRLPACLPSPTTPASTHPAHLPNAALSVRWWGVRLSSSLSAAGESRHSSAGASCWLRTRGEPGSQAPSRLSVLGISRRSAAVTGVVGEKPLPPGRGLAGAEESSRERRLLLPKGKGTGAARRARIRMLPLPLLVPTLPPVGTARLHWVALEALLAAAARAGRDLLTGREGRPQLRFGCGASTSP